MADTPDPQELARRYLDLWQQHLTQAATDPDIAATMAKFWQSLQAGLGSGIPGWSPVAADTRSEDNYGSKDEPARSDAPAEDAPRPSSDRASPDGGSGDFDKLLRRLASLEKRLDALERKPRGGGKRAAKGPEKHRS